MTNNTHISGVAGWLAFLIFALMILGPLMGFARITTDLADVIAQYPQVADTNEWQNYKMVTWLIYSIAAAISFAAGYRLWKVYYPDSVRFAIIALWLSGPFAAMLMYVLGHLVFGLKIDSNAIAEMLGLSVPAILAAIVWTLYLMRSVRVKNTYKLPISGSVEN